MAYPCIPHGRCAKKLRSSADLHVRLHMLLRANRTESCASCGGQILSGDWKSLVRVTDEVGQQGAFHTLCSPIPADRVAPEDLPILVSPRTTSVALPSRLSPPQEPTRTALADKLVLIGLVAIVGGVVALGAFERMPYGYYTFLRICACFGAAVLAAAVESERWLSLRLALIGLAILYNPIIPFHLGRSTWLPINIATIAIFVIALYPASLPRTKAK